ncbi:MAG TPA: winged helix-turn-helix domain-containing protein [Chitinophagaceae bacterium]|nr:winged helix-turn-helix domain-containing protein [Chitinophagaceae bacterium]
METQIAHISSLIGDPVRSRILWLLLDGRAYTATELAASADTSPQNISMHLGKLVQAELLAVESQGRHRYYRFARQEVAYAIEALANLVPGTQRPGATPHEADSAIKYCRTCYDHLAGRMGVLITEHLQKEKILRLSDQAYALLPGATAFFEGFGIDPAALQLQRRSFARPCLDWSERKYHLSGSLGAALLGYMLEQDWLRRTLHSRVIVVTAKGRKALYQHFNIS